MGLASPMLGEREVATCVVSPDNRSLARKPHEDHWRGVGAFLREAPPTPGELLSEVLQMPGLWTGRGFFARLRNFGAARHK